MAQREWPDGNLDNDSIDAVIGAGEATASEGGPSEVAKHASWTNHRT